MSKTRRWFALAGIGATALAATGCITKPQQPLRADGTYCHRTGKTPRTTNTCTPAAVPSAAEEAQAKRLEPVAGQLAVYVVRKRWLDAVNVVNVSADEGRAVGTVPYSFMLMVLAPGEHRLQATWADGQAQTIVNGNAGDIVIVDLVGTVWTWGARYRFEPGDNQSRANIAALKMVGHVR